MQPANLQLTICSIEKNGYFRQKKTISHNYVFY